MLWVRLVAVRLAETMANLVFVESGLGRGGRGCLEAGESVEMEGV